MTDNEHHSPLEDVPAMTNSTHEEESPSLDHRGPSKLPFLALTLFALLGVVFSAISTYDFIQYLDRDFHTITCGLNSDAAGKSGCFAVMMSPFSSLWRSSTWGGLPIALPSFGVFTYLLFFSLELVFIKKPVPAERTLWAFLATLLPLCTSVIYFLISIVAVGSVCSNCLWIYAASIGAAVCAGYGLFAAKNREPLVRVSRRGVKSYAVWFAEGVAFVVLPALLYLALKPNVAEGAVPCGALVQTRDPYGVVVPLNLNPQGAEALELVDPLCPTCRAFRDRLKSSGLVDQLNLKAVVFPLDTSCNWMLQQTLHPGACAVSEAVLCAEENASEVLDWALDNQERLREIASKDNAAIYAEINAAFPKLSSCVGKPAVRAKLNKSLRYLVTNAVSVETPQLFIGGQKMCTQDLDLGLEFVLQARIQELGAALPERGGDR